MGKSNLFISFDDGHPLDLKAAEILSNNRIPGTFYISIKNSAGRPVLTKKEIRLLSQHFEIGAHTYNHVDLTSVSIQRADEEMRRGKMELEEIIGKTVSSFAWPWGRFNMELCGRAAKIGFTNFRGVSLINFHSPIKKGLWFPNYHVTKIGISREIRHLVKRLDFYSLIVRLKYASVPHHELIPVIKKVPRQFHLWTHSWEIEELGLWNILKSL